MGYWISVYIYIIIYVAFFRVVEIMWLCAGDYSMYNLYAWWWPVRPKRVVFEYDEANAFETWISIHRRSCAGTTRRASVNSEYVKQFSLLEVNTAFADNGQHEMGLVHFCLKKRLKPHVKPVFLAASFFFNLQLCSYTLQTVGLITFTRDGLPWEHSTPETWWGAESKFQWLITLISFPKWREAPQAVSTGSFLYSKARWYFSGDRGCILMMPTATTKYLQRRRSW
jgi:hypothetical protein